MPPLAAIAFGYFWAPHWLDSRCDTVVYTLICSISAVPLYVSHAGGAGSAGAGGARGEHEGGDYLTPVRIASGCLSAFPPARMDMLRACGCVVAPVCGCRTDALSLLRRRHAGATSAEGGGGTMGA